jgi:hypothetical protein
LEQFEQAEFYVEHLAKSFPNAQSELSGRVKKIASTKKTYEDRVAKERIEKQYRKEDQL